MSAEHHTNYVKVWGILLALLVVSVLGPLLEIRVVTLVTAFGIAIVKALMVARNFMHINIERRYITYIVTTCLVFMFLFFTATAPDVMKHEGTQWVNIAAKKHVEEGLAAGDGHGEHGGGEHGDGEHGGEHAPEAPAPGH